jgi:hypothetical protein
VAVAVFVLTTMGAEVAPTGTVAFTWVGDTGTKLICFVPINTWVRD